jgi:hypothetical protein
LKKVLVGKKDKVSLSDMGTEAEAASDPTEKKDEKQVEDHEDFSLVKPIEKSKEDLEEEVDHLTVLLEWIDAEFEPTCVLSVFPLSLFRPVTDSFTSSDTVRPSSSVFFTPLLQLLLRLLPPSFLLRVPPLPTALTSTPKSPISSSGPSSVPTQSLSLKMS